MSFDRGVDHRALYRLPWTVSDNVISWLEPTAKCNLACEGCYRDNVDSHKSLAEVRKELDVFNKFRGYDGVSIAGGDPLLHPQIVEIVRMIKSDGHKPVLNTNGLALTEELLAQLKDAGAEGFTFHIDSKQGRPGWKGKNELELNELRLKLANMVADIGGLSCAFNSTVYEDTLKYVPELVQWAEDHIDVVNIMVFITYRAAMMEGEFDYYNQGEKVDAKPLVYTIDKAKQRMDISSRDVVAKIRERFPDFEPSAYLGGSEKPDSLKWLLTGRVGMKGKVMGYVGPKFMELMQVTKHLFTGTYLAYAPPKSLSWGRSMMALGAIDPGLRKTAGSWFSHLARRPLDVTKKLHYQSIMCIQPIDLLADGRQNMCDGCPDLTVHEGELVYSCRLDEKLRFGNFIQTVPKKGACARSPDNCKAVAGA
ncbi:MAG: radical SAM protein [Myxococcaceae bacterium]